MDEVAKILENDEIEKLLIASCKSDAKPPEVSKDSKSKKKDDNKENKNSNTKSKDSSKKDKKDDTKKDSSKKDEKDKDKKESSSSSSSSGSDSESSGGSSSGSGSSSSGSESGSGSSSGSSSSSKASGKKDEKGKKITIDKQTLDDFENKKDNLLIMLFENEIKDQVSNEEEIQILNSFNEAMVLNENNENKNSETVPEENDPPYPSGEDMDDAKFYTSVKECITNIKNNWNNESKQCLKNIIAKFQKTENIFTYRRYLKEPFKSMLTNFLLYIMTRKNLKDEDILKLAEPIIDKSWKVNVVMKDKKGDDKLLGKKTERSGDSSSSSSSESDEDNSKNKKAKNGNENKESDKTGEEEEENENKKNKTENSEQEMKEETIKS